MIMRLCDMFGVLPAMMLLLIAYTYFLSVTIEKETLILAFYFWIPVARVVRAQMLRSAHASSSRGAFSRRLGSPDLLPAPASERESTIIVAVTTLLGQVIVLEATLEFFDIGVPSAVQPTLGNLIGDAQSGSLTNGLGWWTLVTRRGAHPDPRLRQSSRRRAGRSAPPRESALALVAESSFGLPLE